MRQLKEAFITKKNINQVKIGEYFYCLHVRSGSEVNEIIRYYKDQVICVISDGLVKFIVFPERNYSTLESYIYEIPVSWDLYKSKRQMELDKFIKIVKSSVRVSDLNKELNLVMSEKH